MKISLQLPTDRIDRMDQFVTGPAVREMAVTAEAAGFDSVAVTEHPYPDDEWLGAGGHHALDPLVALAFAAAATTRLRVRTNLFVLPYRNPFLSAKGLATLDVLSGGRLVIGVGTGYLAAEFQALGVRFDRRNMLTDEALVAIKRAWSEEGVHLVGSGFAATGNTMLPRPVQRPHPPIWIGGNSKRAIRRAVEHGDGWAPFPNAARAVRRRHTAAIETIEDLRARIDYAHEYAAEVGRERPLGVAFPLGGIEIGGVEDDPVATAERLAAIGVTEVGGGVRPVDSRAEFLAEVERMGTGLVPRIAAIETTGVAA